MPRYAISKEGIVQLEQLAKDLKQNSRDIHDAAEKLLRTITGYEEELGSYYDRVYEMIDRVMKIQREGSESVENLAEKHIPETIQKIENLLTMFS